MPNFVQIRFRGFGVLIPQILPFSIGLAGRPYNSVYTTLLHCDTLKHIDYHINQGDVDQSKYGLTLNKFQESVLWFFITIICEEQHTKSFPKIDHHKGLNSSVELGLLAQSTVIGRSHTHWTGLVGNAVIDTYVQRTSRGHYTCQMNQLISRQDIKGRARRFARETITWSAARRRRIGAGAVSA